MNDVNLPVARDALGSSPGGEVRIVGWGILLQSVSGASRSGQWMIVFGVI